MSTSNVQEQIDVDISEIDAKAGLYHTWKERLQNIPGLKGPPKHAFNPQARFPSGIFLKSKKGLNDTVDTQYYNRDILTQLVDSFIQTIDSQWAALSDEGKSRKSFNHTLVCFLEKSYFGKSLVDLETEIENEMKRKNRKKRDGCK